MEFIKKFLNDKGRVGVAIVCLLMLSVAIVSAMTGETLAASTITVTFDSDGGTILGNSTMTIVPSATATYGAFGSMPSATKDKCQFDGWYTGKNCSANKITEASIIAKQDNHTLVAHWNFNVYFDSNSEGLGSSSLVYSSCYSTYGDRNLPVFERDGWEFTGWYTEKEGGTKVTSDTSITKKYGHTLYAHWKYEKSSTVDVTFDANGGSINGNAKKNMSFQYIDSSSTYSDTSSLPTPSYTKFKFLGWYTEKSGGTLITSDSKIYSQEEHTLYARWEPIISTVAVTFDSDGGLIDGNSTKIISFQYIDSSSIYGDTASLPTPKNGEKVFLGWYTEKGGKGNLITSNSKIYSQEAHRLYAYWDKSGNSDGDVGGEEDEKITYSVTYNANGGTGAPSSQTKEHGVDLNLSSTIPTQTGFTFKGWGTSSNDTSVDYAAGDKYTSNSNIDLFAIWTANTYTIKYDKNGATGSMTNSSHTYGKESKLTKNSFTKEGHTFDGWNTKADGSGTSYKDEQTVKNLSSTNNDTITLYAQWKSNDSTGEEETKVTYYVKYNANGGTGTMDNSKHIYGEASNLSDNTFTRDKYTFTGWNTKADGSGTSYTDGQTVSNLSDTEGEVVTLYAQWTAVEDGGNEETPTDPGDDNADEDNNDNTNDSSDKDDDVIDESPKTGSLAVILVSLISLGTLGGIVFYRKKIKI